MKYSIFLLFFSLICTAAFAQPAAPAKTAAPSPGPASPAITNIDVVNVKLDQLSFIQAAFPFNIRFAITGDIPADCTSIELKYRINPKDKRHDRGWITFPRVNDGNFQHCDTWPKQDGATQFVLVCPGIHPNFHYDFEFDIRKQVSLSADDQKKLKDQLSGAITAFYQNALIHRRYNGQDVDNLNTGLNTFIRAAAIKTPGLALRNKADLSSYMADVRTNLKIPFDQLTGAVNEFNRTNDNYINAKTAFLADLTGRIQDLKNASNRSLDPAARFQPQSQVYLGLSFTPDNPDFSLYSLMDGIRILQKIANQPGLLDQMLQGKAKISGTDIVPAAKMDTNGIAFIAALLQYLQTGLLVDQTPAGAPQKEFTTLSDAGFLQKLTLMTGYLKDRQNADMALQKAAAAFPDVTAGLVTENAITLNTTSIPDVSTSKTPYISVDGGIGYDTNFQTAVSYYGASFYLVPVNLKAPLSNFKGSYLLRQMIFLNVGIANFFGTRPINTYSLLGQTTNSDLIFGLGVRAGRFFRITLDALPYKTNNFDQVSIDTHLQWSFVATIGIDINLLGSLGNLAKTLNLSN